MDRPLATSTLSHSTSKQLWTFPKKKRFAKIKTECPHAAYQTQLTTFNSHYPKFSTTRRKLFQDAGQESPSPANYSAKMDNASGSGSGRPGISFGESRSKCSFSAYIGQTQLDTPGPTDYQPNQVEEERKNRRGFSMRPKTAMNYNYFINDKERRQVPGPSDYDASDNAGLTKISKFASTQTGGVIVRSQRFQKLGVQTSEQPGPTSYEPRKAHPRKFHCVISKSLRSSWIDKSLRETSPGPGDYNIPSEFGHCSSSKSRKKRMLTVG